MGVKVKFDVPKTMSRFSPKFKRAQSWLDNEVLKDCDPYVPFRTGKLAQSGITGTKIGSGKVIYSAAHAKGCYYAVNRRFSKSAHPQACAQWFEKAKAAKCKAWENGVNQILKG